MTRIRYASDLHVDINKKLGISWEEMINKLNLDGIDILVLAGDTAEFPDNLDFCDLILQKYDKIKVIEIPGNHLYYSCKDVIPSKKDRVMNMKEIDMACSLHSEITDRYFFLNKQKKVIDDITFIGATMWTKLGERLSYIMQIVNCMNDFRLILNKNDETISAGDIMTECSGARNFIVRNLNKTKGKCIVITHHAPYFEWLSSISHAFGMDLTPTFKRLKKYPDYWIFGHTHVNNDKTFTYKNGEVKCICNQFGYFKDSEFDPQFNAWKTFDGTKEIVL